MKITIITATFNAGKTLRDCLQSVRAQGVPVEHLVIDGVSSDDTLEIAEEYRGYLAGIVSEPDKGLYDAMNKGISMATGDIVGILNADDVYAGDDVLASVLDAFADPEIDATYGDLVYVDAEDTDRVVRRWRSGSFRRSRFLWGWMPPHPTFFVRRRVYERHGAFNLDLGTAADYELLLRFLFKERLRPAYIPRTLVRMRTGGASNATLANRLAANRMDRQAWRVNDLRPLPWTLAAKPLRKVGQWLS